MEAGSAEYKVVEKGGRAPIYRGPSLVVAAREAARAAKKGKPVFLTGTNGFGKRLYKPELSDKGRWRYVVYCKKCSREMFPDTRSLTCRKCWDPRDSQAHMSAVQALNDAKRRR
jgi:hypothetical protein